MTATFIGPIPAFPGNLPAAVAIPNSTPIPPFPPVHVKAPQPKLSQPKLSQLNSSTVQQTGVWAPEVSGTALPKTPPKASPKTPDPYAERTPVPDVEPAVPKTPPEAIAIANSEKAIRLAAFRALTRRQEVERLRAFFPNSFRKKEVSV